MKITSLLAISFLALLSALDAVAYDCLKEEAKIALWVDAEESLLESKNLLYKNTSKRIPLYPGYITSDESHFHQVAHTMVRTGGDAYLGFGTTINFNLIGARAGIKQPPPTGMEKTRTAIFADQSPDVLIAMHSFWRPLWLVSKNATQWLANTAGFAVDEHANIGDIFKSISPPDDHAKYQHSASSISHLDTQLQALVSSMQISDADRKFTLAMIQEEANGCNKQLRGGHFNENLFMHARNSDVAHCIRKLYDPTGISLRNLPYPPEPISRTKLLDLRATLQALEVEDLTELSFLHNPELFQRVRQVFLDEKDHYALTTIQDPLFWKKAGDLVRREASVVTDVYTTCIPYCIESDTGSCPKGEIFAQIRTLPMGPTGIQVIDSDCTPENKRMRLEHISSSK